jgi:hypothetical protein
LRANSGQSQTDDGARLSWRSRTGLSCWFDQGRSPQGAFALRLSKAFGTSQEIFQPAVPQIATFSGRSLKDIEAILEAHHVGTAKRGGFSRGLDR